MIFKRVNNNGEAELHALIDHQWFNLSKSKGLSDFVKERQLDPAISSSLIAISNLSAESLGELKTFLLGCAETCDEPFENLVPFEPKSFRDFMLFEKHVVDSTRGYVKRFMPKLYRLTNVIEKLTGHDFKKFKPHQLWYRQPIYYFGNHLNFGVSGEAISVPSYTNAIDYELEVGAVLSRPLKNATPEQARRAIGGFVIINDCSARDVQKDEMESGFGPQKAKHFYSTMSCEFLTARDFDAQDSDFSGTVLINGKPVSRCCASDIKYSFAEAISFVSKDEQLHAGELFGSGTLPGGSGMETGNWVHRGDVLTLKVDQIGELTNQMVKGDSNESG